jgi:hypothetical protein
MGKFSENEQLNREHLFYGRIAGLAHFIFVGSAVAALLYSLKLLIDDDGWSVACFLRFALAAGIVLYWQASVQTLTGIFYALHLWEQSLLRRRSDDELIRLYNRGERILKEDREVEVFDGHFLPKPGGMRIRRREEPQNESEKSDA